MSDNELNQPLNQSTMSDSGSVSSQGSRGGSLLERIKAQREREAAMKASSTSSSNINGSNHDSNGGGGGAVDMELTMSTPSGVATNNNTNSADLAESGLQPPSSMEVTQTTVQPQPPMYGPISNNEQQQQQHQSGGGGGLFSRMFGRFRHAGSTNTTAEARESLLQQDAIDHGDDLVDFAATGSDENYTMSGYFQTFIHDIYSLFRSIHPIIQIGLVLIMLFLVFKLI